MLGAALPEHRAALDRLMAGFVRADRVHPSPSMLDRRQAERWLERADGALDGVIAKRLDKPRDGQAEHLEIKTHCTAGCFVGGFRCARIKRSRLALARPV